MNTRSLRAVALLGLASCHAELHAPRGTNRPPPASADAGVAEVERGWHPVLGPSDDGPYVVFEDRPAGFSLAAPGRAATFVVAAGEAPGVRRAAEDVAADVGRVSGVASRVALEPPAGSDAVIVGTVGQGGLVDRLAAAGKIDATDLAGRWEAFVVQVVDQPWPGARRALVVAGSDPRGTTFGLYDLARAIGVSPWSFFDDVPPRRHARLTVLPGRHTRGEPAVKYRGLFINDEAPALTGWAAHAFPPAPRYGRGLGHEFYAKVYELLLRLGGDCLWPAEWGQSLFDDDPESVRLAAEYGVLLGTAHDAPMMRLPEEWARYGGADGPYAGTGEFSFVRNAPAIERYWADGIRRLGGAPGLITVGMRGNNDTALADDAGIPLMRRIVAEERDILRAATGKPPEAIPQVWTLYKEVEQYWDDGMKAPDDVVVTWCDDNWGNIRELPDPSAPRRSGGYGLYYHFDYVGGGRNYKWVDTVSLPNVWEQLHLAYAYGVDRFFMVNVGDLKNEEHPLAFFLDYAWNPERWPIERLPEWEEGWAEQQFGPEHAAEIAAVLTEYGRLQSRRKPELSNRVISLDPAVDVKADPARAVVYRDGSPFSLTSYGEMERVTDEWAKLAARAERIGGLLPAEDADAYFELVLYEVKATANLYALRLAEFRNILYAEQGRASAETWAAAAEARFADDQALTRRYDRDLAGGKWRGFQAQAKFGYGGPYPSSSWHDPQDAAGKFAPDFIWPPLRRDGVRPGARLGVAISGSERAWPGEAAAPVLPETTPFDSTPPPYIEVFRRGRASFPFHVRSGAPWLTVSPSTGTTDADVRATLRVDWARAPAGTTRVPVVVSGAGETVVVQAVARRPRRSEWPEVGFVESGGALSIEAEHFDRAVDAPPLRWKLLPGIGRTAGGMTLFPVTAAPQEPSPDGAHLEYDVDLARSGRMSVWVYLSPRNDVRRAGGLRYAVAFDEQPPQVVDVTTALNAVPMNKSWERNTSDEVSLTSTEHEVDHPGHHRLKLWLLDPTAIAQKLVVDTGGLLPSYLGPPESRRAEAVPAPGDARGDRL